MATLERTGSATVTVLKITGSLNAQGLIEVEQAFREAVHQQHARVVVDLAGVDFVATPAISMLLEAAQYLKEAGGKMVLASPQPRVVEVLHRLHLETLLPVCGALPDAISLAQTKE